MAPPTPTARAIAWTILAMAAFTCVPVGVRVLSAELPAPVIACLRNFTGVLLMMPWVLAGGAARLKPRRFRLHALRAVLNGTGMMLWFWGLAHMVLADAVALQFTLPLFALLFAVLFLGERIGPRRGGAMVVGFAGALIIIRPGFADVGPFTFAVLAAAALYAATLVVMRSQSQTEPVFVMMFWATLLMGFVALGPALFVWQWPSPGMWPWILFIGAGGWLAQYALTNALRLADTKVVVPFDFLRMPFVALVAYPLFGEVPDAFTWIGAAVIAASSTYIAHRDARAARLARAAPPPRLGPAP